jgi:steroid delta-isomerase
VTTPDDLRAAVERYVTTVNGRDPVAISALFTEDAVQADPVSQPPNVGREAIAAFFAGGIAASDAWTFEAADVHTCGSSVAIDFAITVEAGGATMRIRGIEVFDAGPDGRFTSARAYWDDADVTFD